VITYKKSREILDGYYYLIVVNADVTVAYDLHLMKYDIDEKTKQYRLFIFQGGN
jgi:hypothetical protein